MAKRIPSCRRPAICFSARFQVADQRGFRHLDLQFGGRKSALGERRANHLRKVPAGQLRAAGVHRDAGDLEALFHPPGALLAGGPCHPLPDPRDQAGFFGDRINSAGETGPSVLLFHRSSASNPVSSSCRPISG